MVVFMQKKGCLDHASGSSEKFFEFTPSTTLENALLASKTNITFIVDLVLLQLYMCHRLDNGTRVENDNLGILYHLGCQ